MASTSAISFESSSNEHATSPFAQDEKTFTRSTLTKAAGSITSDDEDEKPIPLDPSLLPKGSRDLSFIGLQAFFLGTSFASSVLTTIYLISIRSAWWRLPAFIVCLSIFHFLEYYTTARYNAPSVRASSFLLFNNGAHYALAHSAASVEIIVSNFSPNYQAALVYHPFTVAAGLILVIVGQTVRSIAMKQAGTNFNHIVATEHKKAHVLVTRGLYGYLRHPSYFGFFWWAVGTQLLVGNKFCFFGYAVALWNFFYTRTEGKF